MLDHDSLPLPCPKCSHVAVRPLRWVQENTFSTCPACRTSHYIDKDAAMKRLAGLTSGVY